MGTYIAKLEINDTVKGTKPTTSILSNDRNSSLQIQPNPILDNFFQVIFELKEKEYLHFDIYDMHGRQVFKLLETIAHQGRNEFSFRPNDLDQGVFFLRINGNKKTDITKKLIVE
jgi:hypothetical protein